MASEIDKAMEDWDNEFHTVDNFNISIYVGLREGYEGLCRTPQNAIDICRKYCDHVGLGVTVTPTNFVYVGGDEPGVIVGLIHYPRFPKTEKAMCRDAIDLAQMLRQGLKQQRVSIVFPKKTIMIGPKDETLKT